MTRVFVIASADPLEHVVEHRLWPVEGPITVLSDHVLMQMLAAVVLVLLIPRAVRWQRRGELLDRLTPRGFGNFIEAICQFLREQVARPALGEYTDRFVGYVWTVFFFILVCNLLGLLPLAPLTKWLFGLEHGIGGTPTGNIWVTGTLAVCTLIMIVVNGLRLAGWRYLAHFCPGPLWLAPLLVPVELMGLLAKIFALAVRLFANMIAGHILLAVLLSFIASAGQALGAGGGLALAVPVVLGAVGVNLLEVFVAFLQAFIFTFLTALFIGQAVAVHAEH